MTGMRFYLALVGVWLMLNAAGASQIVTTTVSDTVYRADGSPAQGSVLISWPQFTTMSGAAVTAGSTTVTLGSMGGLSVTLAPNAGSDPIGSYYTVSYHLDDGTVSRENWVVPVSSAPVHLTTVRSTVMPLSVAMQTVSRAYVDTAIAAIASRAVVQLSTPGSSSTACSAGQLWADASFLYVCIATNTIKRTALSSF